MNVLIAHYRLDLHIKSYHIELLVNHRLTFPLHYIVFVVFYLCDWSKTDMFCLNITQKLSLFGSHDRGICNQLQTTAVCYQNHKKEQLHSTGVLTYRYWYISLSNVMQLWQNSLTFILKAHKVLSIQSEDILKNSHQAMMSISEEEDDEHNLDNREDGEPQQEDMD